MTTSETGWMRGREVWHQVAPSEEGNSEWHNMWVSRIAWTSMLIAFVSALALVFADPDTPWWLPVLMSCVAVAMLVGVVSLWTARLTIAGTDLHVRNFFRVTSVPLVDIASVNPGASLLTGMVITTVNQQKVRTLVSGHAGNEWWVPRAHRIAAEIIRRANLASATN